MNKDVLVCLAFLECELHEHRNFVFLCVCSLMHPQLLDQSLAYSRCLISTY